MVGHVVCDVSGSNQTAKNKTLLTAVYKPRENATKAFAKHVPRLVPCINAWLGNERDIWKNTQVLSRWS